MCFKLLSFVDWIQLLHLAINWTSFQVHCKGKKSEFDPPVFFAGEVTNAAHSFRNVSASIFGSVVALYKHFRHAFPHCVLFYDGVTSRSFPEMKRVPWPAITGPVIWAACVRAFSRYLAALCAFSADSRVSDGLIGTGVGWCLATPVKCLASERSPKQTLT